MRSYGLFKHSFNRRDAEAQRRTLKRKSSMTKVGRGCSGARQILLDLPRVTLGSSNRARRRAPISGRPTDGLPPRKHARSRAQISIATILLSFLLLPSAWAEKVDQLKPQGYVSDFAGVIDAAPRAKITTLCAEVDQKTQAQIAVVTIHSLEGVPVEDFAVNLFQRWGIGPKSSDRGVLILLAKDDRQYKIEVGYGLEPILPDGKVGDFGREMVPQLRQGDYGGALLQITGEIASVIAQDRGVTLSSRAPPTRPRPRDEGPQGIIIMLVILGFLVFGGFGGFFLPLAFGTRRGRFGGWRGGPWIGGGWGGGGFGGGGGGGGFGGFGGGMSGGGGAAGGW